MTRNKYDLTIFIGRFSPLHKGHEKVIWEAFKNSDYVMVMPGSDKRPTDSRNPYTSADRVSMIRAAFPNYDYRLIIEPLEDIRYNDPLWMAQVQTMVNNHFKTGKGTKALTPKIALIGYEKDETSFYVNMFPQWDSIGVAPYRVDGEILNATDIRDAIYENDGIVPASIDDTMLSPAVTDWLNAFTHTKAIAEWDHNINYKKQFVKKPFPSLTEAIDGILGDLNIPPRVLGPLSRVMNYIEEQIAKYNATYGKPSYPPIHHTTDAVVIQSGHVLVGQRGAMPGKDLFCLPGGFLNEKEFLIDGMLRELKEETKIKVPLPVLRGNIKRMETFDDPNRSTRGRTITTAYLIELPNGPLPKVKAADDMKRNSVFWLPLSQVFSEDFFEDHYDIIQVMTGMRARKW